MEGMTKLAEKPKLKLAGKQCRRSCNSVWLSEKMADEIQNWQKQNNAHGGNQLIIYTQWWALNYLLSLRKGPGLIVKVCENVSSILGEGQKGKQNNVRKG